MSNILEIVSANSKNIALAASSGIALLSLYRLWALKRQNVQENVYETKKLVNEYMLFHYGKANEVLKFDFGPKNGFEFPTKCAEICIANFKSKASAAPNRALDIGCAVGKFELN